MNEDFEIAVAMLRVTTAILKKAVIKEYGTLDRNAKGKGRPAALHALDSLDDAEYAMNAYMEEQLKLPF